MAISFFTSPQSALRQQVAKFEQTDVKAVALSTIKTSADITAKLVNYQDYNQKRRSKFELFRLCLAVAGIELCYAAETAFVSPIILRLHVPVFFMTLVWAASPLLGLCLNPLLGSLSDSCRSKCGRRRPFIIGLTFGIIIGLCLVPNGLDIGRALGDDCQLLNHGNLTELGSSNYTTALRAAEPKPKHCPLSITFTLLGVMLLDFCCDASQSPCRTYLLDVCHPEDHTLGLSTFTVVSGIGGAIGYVVGGIDWNSLTAGSAFMYHIKVVFMAALGLHTICVFITVTSFREVPLGGDLERSSGKYERFENDEDEMVVAKSPATPDQPDHGGLVNGTVATPEEQEDSEVIDVEEKQLPDISVMNYLRSILKMPSSIMWLCMTNLCCWMSLLCYSLYFTDFVGQAVYKGSPTAEEGTEEHDLYSYGVRIGSFAMSLYSITCSLYSLVIERLVIKFGARTVYIVGQLVACCGSTFIASTCHPVVIFICSPSIGILYATLFTMPYIMLAHYHSKRVFEELVPGEASPMRGLGTDVAVVSSMVFVGQFILSAIMGWLLHITETTVTVMWCSAVLSALGALVATKIFYHEL